MDCRVKPGNDKGKPASRHELVEKRVVGILSEPVGKLQRPDSEGMLKREICAQAIAPEPAVTAHVVAQLDGSALAEKIGNLAGREQDRDKGAHSQNAEDRDNQNANARRTGSAGKESQDHQQRRREGELRPGAARATVEQEQLRFAAKQVEVRRTA